MKKSEYFQEIAKEISKKRGFSELTKEEQKAYKEGQKAAYRNVLCLMGEKLTYGDFLKKIKALEGFLKKEKNMGKLAARSHDTELWEKDLKFSPDELFSFVELNIHDYRARLKKAREIHAVQTKLLQNFTQLTIEE